MKRRTWIMIGVVVLLIGGVIGIVSTRGQASVPSTVSQTAQVRRATLASAVESSGNIAANEAAMLVFGAGGTVKIVNVEVGDHVKQGEVLAQLDTSKLEVQVARAKQAYLLQQATYSKTVEADPNAVTAAQAALTNAQNAYQIALRKNGLSSDQITVSCATVDDAKQAYDDAVTTYNNYVSDWRVQANGTAEVSLQKARLDSAKAAYDVAQANCTLAQKGVNDSSVKAAWSQIQQARANLANLMAPRSEKLTVARAQLEQARLSWEQAKLALRDATIVAPFDSVVTAVNIKAGEPSGNRSAIELADVHQYHVDVLVDETEIAQVQTGQSAQVALDALPGSTLTGTVAAIDPAGQVAQGVVSFNVRVNLDPTTVPIKLNMTTNTRLLGETHANVLTVPLNAIRTAGDGSKYVVVVDQHGVPREVPVTTGLTQGKLTEVAGDLHEGDQVLLHAASRATNFESASSNQ